MFAASCSHWNCFLGGRNFCLEGWRIGGFSGRFLPAPTFYSVLKDKVLLWLHPKFWPKVSSQFHINETIHIPFFPLKTTSDLAGSYLPYVNCQMGISPLSEQNQTFPKVYEAVCFSCRQFMGIHSLHPETPHSLCILRQCFTYMGWLIGKQGIWLRALETMPRSSAHRRKRALVRKDSRLKIASSSAIVRCCSSMHRACLH